MTKMTPMMTPSRIRPMSPSLGVVISGVRKQAGCRGPRGGGGLVFAALERVATWSIHEDKLQLRDADGALQVDYRVAGAQA